MGLINEYLKKIKDAIYGEEVRDSIHDAIEQCYKDATGHPDSVAAVVDGLVTEEKERKTEVDVERKRIDNLIKELPATAGEYQQSKLVLHSYDNTAVKCGTTSGNYTNVPAFVTDIGGPLSSLYTKKSNYQIAVNKSGLYLFELRIHVNSLVANKRVELAPFINGTRNAALASSYNTAGDFTLTQVAALPLWLSANDTVDFRIAPIEAAAVSLQLGDVLVYAIDWEDKFKIPDYTGYAAETKDIRTGADGVVYGTAGEAVRAQVSALTEDLATDSKENPEFLKVYLDSEDRFLWGIRNDGMIIYGVGIPEQIKSEIESLRKEVNEKISGLDKGVVEKLEVAVRELGYTEDNPEYLRVITDEAGKVLWGIRNDGNIQYGAGVPEQIKSEIKKTVDDSTKGIDQFGLYLDENGNICQEV